MEETEITYSRKQLELMKSRSQLAEIALGLGAQTKAKMTMPALIDAILAAQKKRAAARKKNDGAPPKPEAKAEQAGAEPAPAKPKRKRAQRAVKHDEDGQVLDDTGNVAPLPDGMENEPPPPPRFNSPEDALEEIARTSVQKEQAIEALASVRKDLNHEVKAAKAAHKGAMESGVDYKDRASVDAKLESVTLTWRSSSRTARPCRPRGSGTVRRSTAGSSSSSSSRPSARGSEAESDDE
jgi:hypothetical protein